MNFSRVNEDLDYLDGKRESWCDKRWIQFGICKVRDRLDNSIGILRGQIQLFGPLTGGAHLYSHGPTNGKMYIYIYGVLLFLGKFLFNCISV